jgi:hypothetical protein
MTARGSSDDVQELTEVAFRGFLERVNGGDLSAMDEYLDPSYEEVWPQFGERVRGPDNLRAILENYPGGALERSSGRVMSGAGLATLAPNYTVVRVQRDGEMFTSVEKVRYPDGSEWYVVTFLHLQGWKAIRGERYFAPLLPAPEWRAEWVEPIA